MNLIMQGSSGADVRLAKRLLTLYGVCDLSQGDVFDSDMEKHVKEFQIKCGIVSDGRIGPQTWGFLAPGLSNAYIGWNKKEAVQAVQNLLKKLGFVYFRPSGNYGVSTMAAVEDFQTKNGLFSDGVWADACWNIWFKDMEKASIQSTKSVKHVFSFRFASVR